MKLIYSIMVASLLMLSACNRDDRGSVRAAPENTATVDQMKQQRDDYVKAVDAKLAEFDQNFDSLDARAKEMSGTTKRDFNDSIAALRDQRKAVSQKLDDLKSVSVESWMTLKGEVDAAVAGLERSYAQVSATHENVPAAVPRRPIR